MYSFVLFIVFNYCVSELGSHEKLLYRKEDVAREKTQFFQKNVFLGKKHGKKRFFFRAIQNFRFFGTLASSARGEFRISLLRSSPLSLQPTSSSSNTR